MTANLFDRLDRSIADRSKMAVTTLSGERFTYADLITLSGRLANVLVARGVEPGDRVAVQVEKSVPALVLHLVTVRAGAAYLPLNTAHTFAELDYSIGDAESSVVVCDPARHERTGPLAERVGASVATLDGQSQGSLIEAVADALRSSRRRSGPATTSQRSSTHPARQDAPRERC